MLPAPIAAPIDLLDRIRLAWLRLLGPIAIPIVRSRELRVSLIASSAIALALGLCVLAPLWMLALGPIFLGVPHAVSDVRYLVMRPGLHRRGAFWIAIVLPLAILVGTLDVRWGLLAAIGGVIAARSGSIPRRLIALVPAAIALSLAWQSAFLVALAIAHLHNFVAVGLWLAWRPRRSKLHAIPLALFAIGCALILAGALDPMIGQGNLGPDGRGLHHYLALLAPGFEAPWGARLVLLFGFTQSVHYAIWIRLVPEEDRARETPRTFRASLRAWVEDSGWLVIASSVFAALLVIGWASLDLGGARDGYLRGVLFHGYLELAVIALLISEGRSLRSASIASAAPMLARAEAKR